MASATTSSPACPAGRNSRSFIAQALTAARRMRRIYDQEPSIHWTGGSASGSGPVGGTADAAANAARRRAGRAGTPQIPILRRPDRTQAQDRKGRLDEHLY